MASLYENMEEIKSIFRSSGYTVYDLTEFGDLKLSRLPDNQFPVIFVGRQLEEIDNEGSPLHFLSETAGIPIKIVLNTGDEDLYKDSDTVLRDIKNIIATNQCSGSFWTRWVMNDNFVAQLQSSNERSRVYGGININTTISYREEQYKE
jgi:hypothetical protein